MDLDLAVNQPYSLSQNLLGGLAPLVSATRVSPGLKARIQPMESSKTPLPPLQQAVAGGVFSSFSWFDHSKHGSGRPIRALHCGFVSPTNANPIAPC